MLFNIFLTFSAKKSNTGKTGPQPSKPTVTATRQKKPSAFGRVLKALRPSRFKPQVSFCALNRPFFKTMLMLSSRGARTSIHKLLPLTTRFTSNLTYVSTRFDYLWLILNLPASFLLLVYRLSTTTQYFDSYDPYATLTSPDVATPTLSSPALANADSSLLPPPHSTISTPTTVYSEHLPSDPTPEQSPRPSEDLSKPREKPAVRKPIMITSPSESHHTHRSKGINATVNNNIVPPVDGLVGKRDSKAEARQIAIDRLVEALAGHQNAQARPLSELDRLWDAREAKALAKEEEEKARLRAQRSVKRATWEPTRAGLAVEPHSTRERDENNDSYGGPFSLESPATPSRQRFVFPLC